MSHKWFKKRNKCPACASDRFKEIYKCRFDEDPIRRYLNDFYVPQGEVEFEYLDGASYILSECEHCGLIFQTEIPDDFLTERLYEHWINPEIVFQRQQQHKLKYYSSFAQEIMQIISLLGKTPSSLQVLDFGMGWGKWALMAKAFGCNVCGTELSSRRAEHAEENGIRIISWEDISQYQFDFINTEQVFEHIPQPLETLRYLKTALKKNGILKISVPGTKNIARRLKRMDWKAKPGSKFNLNAVAPLEHINCFKRSSLETMASEAEMEEILIPLKIQYRHTIDWSGPKKIFRNFIQPVSRNLRRNKNYIFLRSKQS